MKSSARYTCGHFAQEDPLRFLAQEDPKAFIRPGVFQASHLVIPLPVAPGGSILS